MFKRVVSFILVFALVISMSTFAFGESVTYTVKPGDTLAKIAAKYNMDWNELAKVNNIKNPHIIHVGRTLRITHSVKEEVAVKPVKNVIVMIGDGMGLGQMEIARLFEYGKEGRLFMQSLPNVGLLQTYSADNFVTDSAAAGTALATGFKTYNGGVGVDEKGVTVDSILDVFKKNGSKVGVISTNTVFDATPAAFTASAATRASSDDIAKQLLEGDLDVILGGGSINFGPTRKDGVDLIPLFKEKGYIYVTDKDGLQAVNNADKLFGLFSPSFMSYLADRDNINSKEPNLVEMQAKAIEVLSKADKGFFLMVEGARIDHAAHAADVLGVWKETIDFDNAVREAVKWAEKDGETLVVVVSDHETMGFAAAEPMNIEGLKKIEVSPEFMAGLLVLNETKNGYTSESIKEVFKKYAHIDLTDDEVVKFNSSILEKNGKLYPAHKIGWEIGSIIAEKYDVAVMSSAIRAKSKTGGHTGNMVPVFAYGPESHRFEGVLDNTDFPVILSNIMGYKGFPSK